VNVRCFLPFIFAPLYRCGADTTSLDTNAVNARFCGLNCDFWYFKKPIVVVIVNVFGLGVHFFADPIELFLRCPSMTCSLDETAAFIWLL